MTGFSSSCGRAPLLALAASAFLANAQESPERIAAPPVPAMAPGSAAAFEPVASPVVPSSPVGIAPDMPVAAPAGPDEFASVPEEGVAVPYTAAELDLPTEPMNVVQPTSRVIEDEGPKRTAVYGDDPESAWWEINPHIAFDRAQREQKPLMLLFTGIWNAQAMALSQEVFATKSFNEYVKENLVICYLSYPRNYSDAPPALRKIKDKFKVKGYPNVLLFNPNGEVQRGVRGYRTGRPVDYFNQLQAACRPVLESIREQKAALAAKGYRDWSNYLGKLVFAKMIEHDGTRVVLLDAAGQKWTVPKNDLAPDDQRLVESFPAVDKLSGE